MENGSIGAKGRIDYLDAVRGLAIFLMIFVNYAEQYIVIPLWSKHAPGDGFTYVDGIAPMFVFVMGISAALSFARRRETEGVRKTVLHALRRYGLLFLFGTIGTVIIYLVDGVPEWNIFQTLGLAGLVAFPFLIIRSPSLRIIIALALMGLYQLALTLFFDGALFTRVPPVPLLPSCVQSLALATIVIIGSGVAEFIRRDRTAAAVGITTVISLGLGYGLAGLIAPNRSMGSITYLFFGLGMAAGCLLLFFLIERWFRVRRVPLLSTLGRNPLVIFMIASVFTKVLDALLHQETPLMTVLLVAAALEASCIGIAWLLDRHAIHVKL
jgi:predicted acyltransferase